MRVAIFCETFLPDVNGVTTTLCRLLEHLRVRGHQALLFAPHGAPPEYAGTPIVPLGGMPLPLYPEVKLTPPQPGISAQLRRFRPDVVHLAGPALLGAVVPTIARSLNLPIIGSYHTNFGAYSCHYGLGFLEQPLNAWLRWIHNRCQLNLCPSQATRDLLAREGFANLEIWGRGVDTELFHPHQRSAAWRASLGIAPSAPIFLYVGRIASEKRVDLLVEAATQLPHGQIVIVGDGPFRQELQARCQGMPVHFTGYLKGEALATAYASADAFLFPSDTDTFGQVIQEAMASGLPVIAARSGGALDLVREGTTGLLFRPGSGRDLVRAISELLANPAQRQAYGLAGRRAAEARSWPRVLDELLAHYHAAAAQPTLRRAA